MSNKAPHLYQVEEGWIELASGIRFYFNDPSADSFRLDDIAHSLSNLCRYNGHTSRFYSVAEHCCHMSRWVRRNMPWATRQDVLTAHMHDAPEFVLADLPRPIKHVMPQYKAIEGKLEQTLSTAYGLHLPPWPAWIKDLDTRILVDERAQAMSDSGNEWGTDGLEPLGVELHFWSPGEAEGNFLGDFHDICNG